MPLDYPSSDDWNRLAATYPFVKLQVLPDDFIKLSEDPLEIVRNKETRAWTIRFINKLFHVYKSYILLMYFFEQGIPDDEGHILHGEDGVSIQYFPHFSPADFEVKEEFDFYADVFCFKLFSAWNVVGQILSAKYGLGMKRVTFTLAIDKLKNKDKDLYNCLRTVVGDPRFHKATQLRNDLAYKLLPYSIGSKDGGPSLKDTSSGIGSYVRSKQVRANVLDALELLTTTIEYMKVHAR